MTDVPKISEAEWEIMKVLWNKAPQTANEIVEALNDAIAWKPNTVKTLVSRLVKKNAVGFKEEGRTYLYFPLVSQEESVKAESQSFLKRLSGVALKPMLVNFLREEKLSPEDIEEIKSILEEKR